MFKLFSLGVMLYEMVTGRAPFDGTTMAVEELLESLRPHPGDEDLRGFEWYYLWRLSHRFSSTLRHNDVIYSVAFSSDGKRLATGQLNNGEKLQYAFGLNVGEYKGVKMVSHGGGFFGFRTEMIRFPEQKFSVICLCNLGSVNAGGLARQVADIYLADQLTAGAAKGSAASAKPTFIDLPEPELKGKTGVYRNPVTGSIWKLVVSEGKLQVNLVGANPFGFQLAPLSATHFRRLNSPPETEVKFQKSGAVLRHDQS